MKVLAIDVVLADKSKSKVATSAFLRKEPFGELTPSINGAWNSPKYRPSGLSPSSTAALSHHEGQLTVRDYFG